MTMISKVHTASLNCMCRVRASTSCAHESGWLTTVLVVGNIIHFDVFARAHEYDNHSYEFSWGCIIHLSYMMCHSFISFIWVGFTHVCMLRVHVMHMCQYTHPHIIDMITTTSSKYPFHCITMTHMDFHDTTALSLRDVLAQVRPHVMPPGWRVSHQSVGRLCPAPS